MATLKDHQQAMVDLLASGSGIPASASRLAHAMHDLIDVLYVVLPNLPRTKYEDWLNVGRETRLTITPDLALDVKDIIRAVETNSPGLNDKALADAVAEFKVDSPCVRPTPAEVRIKQLENTVNQLRASNAKLKGQLALVREQRDSELRQSVELVEILKFYGVVNLEEARSAYREYNGEPEQAGVRKDDTQVCGHEWFFSADGGPGIGEGHFCARCGVSKK